MGKCKKRTVKFIKWTGRQLKPAGIALIAKLVGIAETTGLSGTAKRALVIAAAKASLVDVQEGAIRVAIQLAHHAMAIDPDDEALGDLGDVEDRDLVDDAV